MGMEIYWILGTVGVVLTLFLVVFDGLMDFMAEPVLLMLSFAAGIFGFAGVAANELLPGNTLALILAPSVIAIGSTFLFSAAYRGLKNIDEKDASFRRDPTAMIGKEALVSWWHGEEGEIIVDYVGQPTTVKAFAEAPVSSGSQVVILGVDSHGVAQVAPRATLEG